MATDNDNPNYEYFPPEPDDRDLFVFLMMHELVVVSALLDLLERGEG
jgi:hypothetical protein